MYKIIRHTTLNDSIKMMDIYAPLIAHHYQAGQFVILRANKEGERIPLTIVSVNTKEGLITIIYQIVGHSTRLLSTFKEGEYILDVVGPLGMPINVPPYKKVIGVAGGVGVAPLLPQLKAYYQKGIEVDVIIGAKSKEYILLEKEFLSFCHHVYITTDDGSFGKSGLVTTMLEQVLEKQQYDQVIAIGPVPMMKAVVDITKPKQIKTSVSLNPLMIDGTGMCGCCRVSIDGKIKFACIDGPDFDGLVVDFDELINRQKMFIQHEATMNDQDLHLCHLLGGDNYD